MENRTIVVLVSNDAILTTLCMHHKQLPSNTNGQICTYCESTYYSKIGSILYGTDLDMYSRADILYCHIN